MRIVLYKIIVISCVIMLSACSNLFINLVIGHPSIHGWEKKSLKCIKNYNFCSENEIEIALNYFENPNNNDSLFIDLFITPNQNDSISINGNPFKYDESLSNTFIVIEKKGKTYKKYKNHRINHDYHDYIDMINDVNNNGLINLRLKVHLRKGQYRAKLLTGFYKIYYTIPVIEDRCKIESDWEYFTISESGK